MTTNSRPRRPREYSRNNLVGEMWATMTQSREDKQYATSSLTGERLAKILGDWPEKGQAAPALEAAAAEPEVQVPSSEPLSGEEWDRVYGA